MTVRLSGFVAGEKVERRTMEGRWAGRMGIKLSGDGSGSAGEHYLFYPSELSRSFGRNIERSCNGVGKVAGTEFSVGGRRRSRVQATPIRQRDRGATAHSMARGAGADVGLPDAQPRQAQPHALSGLRQGSGAFLFLKQQGFYLAFPVRGCPRILRQPRVTRRVRDGTRAGLGSNSDREMRTGQSAPSCRGIEPSRGGANKTHEVGH